MLKNWHLELSFLAFVSILNYVFKLMLPLCTINRLMMMMLPLPQGVTVSQGGKEGGVNAASYCRPTTKNENKITRRSFRAERKAKFLDCCEEGAITRNFIRIAIKENRLEVNQP